MWTDRTRFPVQQLEVCDLPVQSATGSFFANSSDNPSDDLGDLYGDPYVVHIEIRIVIRRLVRIVIRIVVHKRTRALSRMMTLMRFSTLETVLWLIAFLAESIHFVSAHSLHIEQRIHTASPDRIGN